jgi:hypothetical protein
MRTKFWGGPEGKNDRRTDTINSYASLNIIGVINEDEMGRGCSTKIEARRDHILFDKFEQTIKFWYRRHRWEVDNGTHSLTHSLHGAGYYLKSWLSLSLSKNIPLSYGTRRFITVFTKARHWTLSWASRIQFAPSIPISLRSISMLSSHLRLRLPSGL